MGNERSSFATYITDSSAEWNARKKYRGNAVVSHTIICMKSIDNDRIPYADLSCAAIFI